MGKEQLKSLLQTLYLVVYEPLFLDIGVSKIRQTFLLFRKLEGFGANEVSLKQHVMRSASPKTKVSLSWASKKQKSSYLNR